MNNTTTNPPETQVNINRDDVRKFFDFLGSTPKQIGSEVQRIYCVCWMLGDEVIRGLGSVFRTVDEILAEYHELVRGSNESVNDLPTLHVTLNETNLKGRKRGDIVGCRVLCLDIDRVIGFEERQKIEITCYPHLAVESSPGKYHFYWKIDPTILLETWSILQAGVASLLSGDLNLSQTTHLIRVPGFPRVTKGGELFVPSIVGELSLSVGNLSFQEIEGHFPNVIEAGQKALSVRTKKLSLVKKGVKELGSVLLDDSQMAKLASTFENGNRNTNLYEACKEFVVSGNGGVTCESVLEFGVRLNDQLASPLEAREVEKTCMSAWEHGVMAREHKKEKVKEATKKYNDMYQVSMDSQEIVLDSQGLVLRNTLDDFILKNPVQPFIQPLLPDIHFPFRESVSTAYEPAFLYDYTDPFLNINRFTDSGIFARVIQKHGSKIVRVGKGIYAFDVTRSIWSPVGGVGGGAQTLSNFVSDVVLDVFKDEKFVSELCVNGKGEFSIEKQKAQEQKLLSVRTIQGVTGLVQGWSGHRKLKLTDFDSDEELLYCANGVVNLRDGSIRTARDSDYLLSQTGISWSSESVDGECGGCPWWENFLLEVFAENADPARMVSFMQELFGYTLSGSISEQKIFVHFGSGANGKSKILECLAMLCGGYSARMMGSNFGSGKGTGFSKELERIGAKFEGKRAVIIDDLDVKMKWNEGLVKSLTAPTLAARKLYEDEKDIPNRAKIHMGCNEAPEPESENYGILRRMCIIPYPRRFVPSATKEAEIWRMMHQEASGILGWAVKGYQRTMTDYGGQIQYPDEVTASIEEYREEHFNVEELVKEMFEKGKNHDDWHDIQELVDDVNARLDRAGLHQKKTNSRSLGKILSSTLKLEMKRRTEWSGKKRFYFVKLKYNKNETKFENIL